VSPVCTNGLSNGRLPDLRTRQDVPKEGDSESGRGRGHDHGARLVILNAEPTPYDILAGAVLRGPLGELLPLLFLGLAA
jgi:hypothetical protein